jgi:hypothetical protein
VKDQRVDRKSLEALLQELLYLQYRFEFMRRSSMMRMDTCVNLEQSLDEVSADFDRLISGFANVPASGPFKRQDRKSGWWEKF